MLQQVVKCEFYLVLSYYFDNQEDIGDFIDCAQPTASMMDFWISPSMMHLSTWCSIHDVDMGEFYLFLV